MPGNERNELKVIEDLYQLILWSHEHVSRFPRHARFTLGTRVESHLLETLELLLQAKFSRSKTEILDNANIELEKLRFWFRLAKDTKALSIKSHEFAIRTLIEISKQVTGWANHARVKEPGRDASVQGNSL